MGQLSDKPGCCLEERGLLFTVGINAHGLLLECFETRLECSNQPLVLIKISGPKVITHKPETVNTRQLGYWVLHHTHYT